MINLLHLSDLHLTESDECERKEVLESFILELKEFIKKTPQWTPDYLILSGDLTFRGEAREFDNFKSVFKRIRKELNFKEQDVIIVPGNHDKCWDDSENSITELISKNPSIDDLKKEIKKYDISIGNKLEKSNSREKLFVYFNSFCEKLDLPKSELLNIAGWDPSKERTQGIYLKKSEKFNLIFIAINSAYYSLGGNLDYGRLQLDKKFIAKAEKYVTEFISKHPNTLVFSIMHHNPSWFKWEERLSLPNAPATYSRIIKVSNLIFSGHEHSVKYFPDFLNCSAHSIIGGATYTDPESKDTFYSNNFSIISINEDDLTFKRRNFVFSSKEGKDTNWDNYDNDKDYSLHHILPTQIKTLTDLNKNLEREVEILKRILIKDEDFCVNKVNFDSPLRINIHKSNESELFEKLFGLHGLRKSRTSGSEVEFYIHKMDNYFIKVDFNDIELINKILKTLKIRKLKEGRIILVLNGGSVKDLLGYYPGFSNFVTNGQLFIISAELNVNE